MLNTKINFEIIDHNTTYKSVKKLIKSDPLYKLIPSKTEKKSIINQHLDEMKKLLKQQDKFFSHNEIHSTNLDIQEKKKLLEKELAISEFENLLKEKINKNEISWEEALRKFGNDSRWKNENINETKKMEIFKEYMFNLRENKKKEFRKLLQDKIGLNQEVKWHDAQHLLQNDERFREVQGRDREIIFTEYMTFVQEKIVEEYAKFIEECELITKDLPTEGMEFKNFVNKLNYDIRFQRMYKHPDKRDKLIKNRIKFLKFQFEKQRRQEAKMNNRYRPNYRNTSDTWEKGNIIK
jgi:hypothetical protein